MTAPRLRPAMVLLNDGRVLVAGGLTAGSQALSSAEIYDPKTRTFRATSAPMANRHSSPAAVLLNDGRVLISDAQTDAPSFEIYDPATDRFTAPPQPAVHHLNAPLVKLPDGRVVVPAGNDLVQIPNALIEIFDPATNRWVERRKSSRCAVRRRSDTP